jgi:histone-lysine N-methyltransferase SETMAR
MNFEKEDIRKIIYFLWKENCTPPEMRTRINNVFGNETITSRTCQRWVSNFKNGNFEVKDSERSGRPSLDIDDEIVRSLENDRYGTAMTIGEEIGINKETVRSHLLKMGKKFLCNRWLAYSLSDDNKRNRMRICNELLDMHRRNNFLSRIITVDETWIFWKNERSYLNKSWFGSGDQPTTSVRQNKMTICKFLATVFWDSKGLILLKILPQGETIKAPKYCQYLDELNLVIRQQRRRECNDLYFLHDNAKPHIAVLTKDKLNDLGFTLLPHPAYSPDLSPSDFYLFSPMKNALRRNIYDNNNAIRDDLNIWFQSKERGFFSKAFEILPTRWQKCINVNGEYFQHLRDVDE